MLTSLADMWQQHKFTPAWSKSQWVHWAIKRWPNESVDKFKQMKLYGTLKEMEINL